MELEIHPLFRSSDDSTLRALRVAILLYPHDDTPINLYIDRCLELNLEWEATLYRLELWRRNYIRTLCAAFGIPAHLLVITPSS